MSASTIDPRIRARRIAVQRDVGRKRLRRLTIGAAAVAVVVGAWGITLTPLLDVDHIEVRGAVHSGTESVQQATGIAYGDALLTVHLGRAAAQVTRLPWVQSVEVHRHWPGTVTVNVVERTATAAVPARAGGWILLDATGRQLALTQAPAPGILRIKLAPVATDLGASVDAGTSAVLQLASTVPVSLKETLIELRPAPGGAVEGTVKLSNGQLCTVLFGQPTQAAAKWLAVLSVLRDAAPGGLFAIDVRVPAAPALTRH